MRGVLTFLRWVLGLICLVYAVRHFWAGRHIDTPAAAGHLVAGIAMGLAAVFLLLSGLVYRVCEFLARPLTGLMMPADRAGKPPLSYRLARRYAGLMRHEEAMEEYQKILEHYPDEREAYFELAAVARAADNDRVFRRTVTAFEKRFREMFPTEYAEIANRSLLPPE